MRFRTHRTRMPFTRHDLPPVNRRTGVPRRDFRALALPSVPGCQRVFSPRQAGGSLEVLPFQGTTASRLARASARKLPSRAWPALSEDSTPPAPQGIDQRPADPTHASIASQRDATRATLLGFSCLLVPTRWECRRPGLWIHLTGDRASPPSPTLFLGTVF
jgi:hypothetical protein